MAGSISEKGDSEINGNVVGCWDLVGPYETALSYSTFQAEISWEHGGSR